jgi:hypothetical protein
MYVPKKRRRGTSVSTVSDYGLDDPGSSPCIQTGSGAHPDSYQMGTGGSFPQG